MKKIILDPEIYLAGTMSSGGPAAAFFQIALSKRDAYAFLVNDWLLSEVAAKMVQAGYTQSQADEQTAFIASLFTKSNSKATSLEEFATSESVQRVFVIGERAGTAVDGVDFLPVSELTKELQ